MLRPSLPGNDGDGEVGLANCGSQNKDKTKKGNLPQQMMDEGRYLAANTVGDVWICYPWEATYVPLLFSFFQES